MNRTAKSVQSWMLAAVVFVAGAFVGTRAVTPGQVAGKHVQHGIVFVDDTKPCPKC